MLFLEFSISWSGSYSLMWYPLTDWWYVWLIVYRHWFISPIRKCLTHPKLTIVIICGYRGWKRFMLSKLLLVKDFYLQVNNGQEWLLIWLISSSWFIWCLFHHCKYFQNTVTSRGQANLEVTFFLEPDMWKKRSYEEALDFCRCPSKICSRSSQKAWIYMYESDCKLQLNQFQNIKCHSSKF